MSLTCILMGQDNLLIQCGKYLLENYHQIKWVVSPVKSIQTWCDKNNIPWVTSLNQLPIDKENSVDYLFSIVNGIILKAADLRIARFGTINYHDSILPKYAGINATSWAIINGETTHGITWHMVNEEIDEGDIVYQSSFPLSTNETALTLNLRCFDEATKGFSEMIQMIQSSSLTKKKQNIEVRSYYGLNHALPDLGFIHWETANAQHIDLLCRALNFGNYSNNLGTLKLYLEDCYLIVLDVEKSSQICATKQGGVVLAIDKDGLLISTISDPILIKKLITFDGKVVTIDELSQNYGLKVNYQLPLLDSSIVQSSLTLYSRALSEEKFWLNQLNQVVDHTTYSDRIFVKDSEPTELAPIAIEQGLMNKINNPCYYLLASVLVYLYRLNNYENSTVFLSHNQPSVMVDFNKLWSPLLPMTPDLNSDFTCNQVLEEVARIIDSLSKRGTYLNDIYVRQPSLMSSAKECVITVGITNGEMNVPKNSLIHFDVDQKTGELRIAHRLDTQFQGGTIIPLIERMSAHLSNILQCLLHHPEILINKLVFLTEEEQKKLFAWGVGEYIPLPSNTITDLFEQSVKRAPNNPAIYLDDQFVTYHQLWQEAEKITAFINELNLLPQSPIVICVEQGVSMVALILGIAKAGCICVPLNINYPIMEMKLDVIISSEPSFELLTKQWGHKLSPQLYKAQDILAKTSAIDNLQNRSLPHQEIMLFIDEQSGKKCDTLTQKNIINYCFWFNHVALFTTQSILDLSSPLPFKVLTPCLLAPLFTGGALAIGTVSPQRNAKDYLGYLQHQKISHLRLTPADWELLMTYPDKVGQLNTLSHLLLTSDIEPVAKASEWLSFCPDSRFIILPEAQFQ